MTVSERGGSESGAGVMTPRYFEDYQVGQIVESGERSLSEADILAFGKAYAPLPYHTDPEAAKTTPFGGLVAAGYQTLALTFRLAVETGILASSTGSPGIDQVRWLRPVRPGDSLRVRIEVAEVLPADEKRKRDALRLRYTTINQNDEPVMTVNSLHFLRRRPAPAG